MPGLLFINHVGASPDQGARLLDMAREQLLRPVELQAMDDRSAHMESSLRKFSLRGLL